MRAPGMFLNEGGNENFLITERASECSEIKLKKKKEREREREKERARERKRE